MFLDVGGVRLKVIDLTRFEREAVWTEDMTTLLYIRATLGVTCTYSYGGMPRLTSATVLSPDARAMLLGIDPTRAVLNASLRGEDPEYIVPTLEDATPGTTPIPETSWRTGPETDVALQNHLWRPRQKLILWAYDRQTGNPVRWLESPRPGLTRDLTNGPRPLSVDVVSASGEPSSVGVHYQIQTDLSPNPSGADKLILSHRWQMTHEPDQDQYLTRTIEGTIVFNAAVLANNGVQPDWFRNQLLHPIPLGFERASPIVTLSPDGLVLKYTIHDKDPTITFDPGNSGATQIEVVEKVTYQNPTTWNGE